MELAQPVASAAGIPHAMKTNGNRQASGRQLPLRRRDLNLKLIRAAAAGGPQALLPAVRAMNVGELLCLLAVARARGASHVYNPVSKVAKWQGAK